MACPGNYPNRGSHLYRPHHEPENSIMTPINTKESGGAIKAEFKPQAGDVVITRQRASAFYGTALMAQLPQLGVRTVIVCGESTYIISPLSAIPRKSADPSTEASPVMAMADAHR
jgi:nicotinamidase-related amidase